MEPMLKLGLPKGSLQDSTIDLFAHAGFKIQVLGRSYIPSIDDPDISCLMFRSQEMARYVAQGIVDCGIAGHDWVVESGADVHEVSELAFSRATSKPFRWVLAVPQDSPVQRPEDLEGGLVATELVGVTRRYFADRGVAVEVEFSWGATEVKASFVDAIVDGTETGSSLRANNLRIVDELLVSTTRLVANHEAWANAAKRQKIEAINTLLQGALAARTKVGLKINVPRASLDDVLAVIGTDGEHAPTISPLVDDEWVALEVILDERSERNLIPALQRAGASGFVSYPLNKVIS
jgi:ATP phosphoribosyltransferase